MEEKDIKIESEYKDQFDLELPPNPNYLLEVRHLKKYFPLNANLLGKPQAYLRAVDDISFGLEKGKTIGIVAHRAPQLALEVITKGITWEEAINNDWRKTGDWQPGWVYIVE